MTRFLFFLTLFFLFVIEGTVVQIFSPASWGVQITVVPRFVVVLLIFTALFLGRFQGLWMGIFFGLLYDIVYGAAIGIYGFSMALVGYFSGLTFKVFPQNIFIILGTLLMALIAHETIVYGLLALVNAVAWDFKSFYLHRLIPVVILNMLFGLLVSWPARIILIQLKAEEEKS
jgi:rod shape-determining protein MreD